MRIEDGWVYPETMEDLIELGVIRYGDQYEALDRTHGTDLYWNRYADSVGKEYSKRPNALINPLASRRPLANYQPPPQVEQEHFI